MAELVLFRACKKWGIVELKDLENLDYAQILDISFSIYNELQTRGYFSDPDKMQYKLKETVIHIFCPLFCNFESSCDLDHGEPAQDELVVPKVTSFRYNRRFNTPESRAIAKALLDVGVNPFYTNDELLKFGYSVHTQEKGIEEQLCGVEGERGTIEIYLYKDDENSEEYKFISRMVKPC